MTLCGHEGHLPSETQARVGGHRVPGALGALTHAQTTYTAVSFSSHLPSPGQDALRTTCARYVPAHATPPVFFSPMGRSCRALTDSAQPPSHWVKTLQRGHMPGETSVHPRTTPGGDSINVAATAMPLMCSGTNQACRCYSVNHANFSTASV